MACGGGGGCVAILLACRGFDFGVISVVYSGGGCAGVETALVENGLVRLEQLERVDLGRGHLLEQLVEVGRVLAERRRLERELGKGALMNNH